MSGELRVLMVGHHISGEATGEGFVAFKLAEALSSLPEVRLTVATLQSPRHTPIARQLPGAEVVTWPQPQLFHGVRQFRELVKPEWPVFGWHLRRFLAREAGRFDVAHQIMPAAMRYATPLRGFGLPYVLGPFGGTVETPPTFRGEAEATAPWFTRLRDLDRLRLRRDPRLRASYRDAAMILGVAPYIREILRETRVPMRRYATMLKLGIEEPAPPRERRARASGDPLRLLHVGRAIRTKGLRDLVRAMGHLRDDPRFALESAGGGEEVVICRAEAERLGVADRIAFHGRVPRSTVEDLYQAADVFAFPSFREPAGNVLFEAMRWGLPVVAARAGGPDAIVDDSCGLKVEVTDPERFPRDIAAALRRLADEPGLLERLSEGARARVADGLWINRGRQLAALYRAALETPEGTEIP